MKSHAFMVLGMTLMLGGGADVLHAADVKLLKASSFPLVVSAPGSYRLKRNLDMNVSSQPNLQNLNAVEITTDNVTLDLNGYTVSGPCPSQPCAGTGIGITAAGTSITVMNGNVEGMPQAGISLNNGTVERVNARRNGSGIEVNSGRVHACSAAANDAFGIVLSEGVLTSNYTTGNGDSGIDAQGGAVVVTGNVATFNDGFGIDVSLGVVSGNATDNNNADNIQAGLAIVSGNTATNGTVGGIGVGVGTAQGNLSTQNNGVGLEIGQGLMTQNAIVDNGGVGAEMSGSSTQTAYTVNVITDNGGGDVSGGTQIAGNLCGVDLTCP